jgi:dihydrofolate synthase/folylpolyglutamate synthase
LIILHEIDFAVIETGLGGRLDSTNVISPVVSLITNIGYDHMDLLGNTLPEIAKEKAGIIKSNTPAIISERQAEVQSIFMTKAREVKAPLAFAEDQFQIKEKADGDKATFVFNVYDQGELVLSNLHPDLKGHYQKKNIPGVLASIKALQEKGYKISKQNIQDGIENVIPLTGLKGRWQKLGEMPLIICDTGHNIGGLKEVVKQIRLQKFRNLYIVLGMVKDKDISNALLLLPKEAYYFFCQATIPRALDANILYDKATAVGLRGEIIPDVNKAVAAAKMRANVDDFIFIGGSTFVVGEVNEL